MKKNKKKKIGYIFLLSALLFVFAYPLFIFLGPYKFLEYYRVTDVKLYALKKNYLNDTCLLNATQKVFYNDPLIIYITFEQEFYSLGRKNRPKGIAPFDGELGSIEKIISMDIKLKDQDNEPINITNSLINFNDLRECLINEEITPMTRAPFNSHYASIEDFMTQFNNVASIVKESGLKENGVLLGVGGGPQVTRNFKSKNEIIIEIEFSNGIVLKDSLPIQFIEKVSFNY